MNSNLEAELVVLKLLVVQPDESNAALKALPQILKSLAAVRAQLRDNPALREDLVISKLDTFLKTATSARIRGALVETISSLGEISQLGRTAIKSLAKVLIEPPSETRELAQIGISLIGTAHPDLWNNTLSNYFAQEASAQGVPSKTIRYIQTETADVIAGNKWQNYYPVFKPDAFCFAN